MPVLLIAEHNNERLGQVTARAMTAAVRFGSDVHVLVAGSGCHGVAEQAARLAGVSRVLLCDAEIYAHHLGESLAALIAALTPSHDTIVAPASANGKNTLPRVAAMLDVMQVSDVIEILGPDTFVRPVYAANAFETVRTADTIKVLTVRTSAFPASETGDAAAHIEHVAPGEAFAASRFLREELSTSDRPELASSRIVISGGRAFNSRENFDKYLEPLANKLGAAIGASRAAVDAGYAPNDLQVGQTGKVVAPDLYIACGISGAIQHLAGMKDSKCVVAINTDADAPIFQIADYGLVGNIFDVLPELTEKL